MTAQQSDTRPAAARGAETDANANANTAADGPVIARAVYRGRVEWMDTLVLERIGTSSMTYRFEVWGEADEKNPRCLAAHGRYVTVHVPKSSGDRRSELWPQDSRTRLSAEC